ncbi:hypothetical protein GQR58_004484 [Nymphon striatum]|nr:hypothetical protein GQR58_004484 [Nymphon striatum]
MDAPYYEINSTVLADVIIGMQEGRVAYPQYNPQNIPEFNFKCSDQPYPGYYADPDFDCQIVHQCDLEREVEGYHVCPNMTVFHQVLFTCFWAPFVDCQSSPNFYYLNEQLYVEPDSREVPEDNVI